ncbi:hypothetical protein BO82DRAFT_95789 [Aspergillus uvarum CBS 121591]|uniref:Secreted protein n=1 Tax=Aspergillus uvarum CBS 121591 TaxID=1448315 RepID=A0A319CQR8_9EURO|nr:hypothetical protein BO82DRAFT_95789 [Aspergillus uvarum CBS 121591]PYH81143.1 hypothetical protein BO82DRAFT_95789 [Aspergillus uvarum CBS 121591]
MTHQLLTLIVFRALSSTYSKSREIVNRKKKEKKKKRLLFIGANGDADNFRVCDASGFDHPHRTMPVGTGKPLCCVVPWHSSRTLLPLVKLGLDYQSFVFAVGKVVCGGHGFPVRSTRLSLLIIVTSCWW